MVEILISIIILILLVVGFYLMLRSMTLISSARRNMSEIYERLNHSNEVRVEHVEKMRREYGIGTTNVMGKGSFVFQLMQKMDNMLIYSGVGIKHKWLNTSIYMVMNIVGTCMVFLLTIFFTENVMLSLFCALIVVLAPLLYMSSLCSKNYKQTEEQLTFFINMVSNISAGTSDLILVFQKAADYAKEPLRSAIGRAESAADLTKKNKVETFVSHLSKEIEHPFFADYISTLEVCSKNNANYAQVSKDFDEQLGIVIENTENQRAVFEKVRNILYVLAAIFVFVVFAMAYMVSRALGRSLWSVLITLFTNPVGNVVLFLEAVLWGIPAVYIVMGSRR